jgi:hypothetical protein
MRLEGLDWRRVHASRGPDAKNTLVAGSDGGAEHWAVIAPLIESRKLLAASRTAIWATSLSASSMATPTGTGERSTPRPEESAA